MCDTGRRKHCRGLGGGNFVALVQLSQMRGEVLDYLMMGSSLGGTASQSPLAASAQTTGLGGEGGK